MIRKHTGAPVRVRAEYLGDSWFRYRYPCGHTEKKRLMAGPHRYRKPMNETACRMFAKYWSKEGGGVSVPPCKRCKKKSDGQATATKTEPETPSGGRLTAK